MLAERFPEVGALSLLLYLVLGELAVGVIFGLSTVVRGATDVRDAARRLFRLVSSLGSTERCGQRGGRPPGRNFRQT